MSARRIMDECIMKDCYNKRYKDKFLCEKHWKNRRLTNKYRDDWF